MSEAKYKPGQFVYWRTYNGKDRGDGIIKAAKGLGDLWHYQIGECWVAEDFIDLGMAEQMSAMSEDELRVIEKRWKKAAASLLVDGGFAFTRAMLQDPLRLVALVRSLRELLDRWQSVATMTLPGTPECRQELQDAVKEMRQNQMVVLPAGFTLQPISVAPGIPWLDFPPGSLEAVDKPEKVEQPDGSFLVTYRFVYRPPAGEPHTTEAK